MNNKHYEHRDVMKQGQVYCDHVMAMTAEGLHQKSDIAAELAHRDIRIAKLEKLIAEHNDSRECQGWIEVPQA